MMVGISASMVVPVNIEVAGGEPVSPGSDIEIYLMFFHRFSDTAISFTFIDIEAQEIADIVNEVFSWAWCYT